MPKVLYRKWQYVRKSKSPNCFSANRAKLAILPRQAFSQLTLHITRPYISLALDILPSSTMQLYRVSLKSKLVFPFHESTDHAVPKGHKR